MDYKGTWLKGVYSVEAALLFGIIFLLLEGMLAAMFSFHDRVIIREAAIYFLAESNDGDNIQEKNQLFLEECNQRCLICTVKEAEISESDRKKSISYQVETDWIFKNAITQYLKKGETKEETLTVSSEIDAPRFLRLIHGLIE